MTEAQDRHPQWMDPDGDWHDYVSVRCPRCGVPVQGETMVDAECNLGWHLALDHSPSSAPVMPEQGMVMLPYWPRHGDGQVRLFGRDYCWVWKVADDRPGRRPSDAAMAGARLVLVRVTVEDVAHARRERTPDA